MSEQTEPIVTAEQRDRFRAYVDDARARFRNKFTMAGQPISARSRWTAVTWDVLFAVADRFTWLEAERERLTKENETLRGRLTEWQQTCQDWIDNGVSRADLAAFLFDDVRIDAGWPRE